MRNIPTITKNLLIINILAFLATYVLMGRGIDLRNTLGLHFFLATDFKIWQLLTYLFIHADFWHLFFNMFALWMFGCVVERVWGPKRFLVYYLVCGIGAGLIQEISQFTALYITLSDQGATIAQLFSLDTASRTVLNSWTTVGASGAIYGILLAFGMIFPEERIFIFPLPVPIKAKWFVIIYIGIELFSAIGASDNVAHFAHLGGMLFGFLLIRYWKRHPELNTRYGRSNGQQFFDNLRSSWERHKHHDNTRQSSNNTSRHNRDWDYNSRKKAEEAETDRILDKIRKNGYASLTAEEKEYLFKQSNKK